MSKISNDRPEGSSYGLSRDTKIELYLDCEVVVQNQGQPDQELVLLDLRSLATVYVAKFSRCHDLPFKIVLCPDKKKSRPETETLFALDLKKKDGLEYSLSLAQPDKKSQIHSCVFPAVFVPDKKLCITGLCSVVRFLLRNTCDQIPGHSCETLLGYMGK